MKGFVNRKHKTSRIILCVLIYVMAVFPVLGSTGWSAPAPAAESEELSAQDKQNLVQQGVDHYKQGKHDEAQKNLELARNVFPENYAAPYYLGLIYLEQGRRAAAIAQWRQYVKMDPKSENALRIRKNLTLLLREEARESARTAVANEATLIRLPADDNTVAISAFKNMGSADIQPLGKGMAALLIHDLSLVSDLQVVERVKLQALLQEMKLGTSGLVDAQTAPKVGKLLKAKHVTSGSLADLEKESLQIASALLDADQTAGISTQEAQGQLKQFYDLEKQIACQIIEDLGKDCDKVPAGFNKIHTKSMPALVAYSRGLAYSDEEKYDKAREMFQKALEEDPRFDLAAAALLATPTLAMMSMNTSQMIASASSSGPASAAAGTAVVATTSGLGIVPIAGIVGGVATVGAVAAASGGGGSDDGTPPPPPDGNGGDTDGTVTSREVTISVIDINSIQDDFYDLYVNGVFIGPVNNPPGGTTTYNVTLNSGANTIELRLTETQGSGTYLQININSGEFAREFSGSTDHSWTISAP